MDDKKFLEPHHVVQMDLKLPGFADLINRVIAAGIPGVSWQEILVYVVEHGAPVVFQWLQGVWEKWKQGTLTTPAPPPNAKTPGIQPAI